MAYHVHREGEDELSSGSEWSDVDDAGNDSDWADEQISSDSEDSEYEATRKNKKSKSAAKSNKKGEGKRKNDGSFDCPPAKKQKENGGATKTGEKKTHKATPESNVKKNKSDPERSDSDTEVVRVEKMKRANKSKRNSADSTKRAGQKGTEKRGMSAESENAGLKHYDPELPFFQQRALDLINDPLADDLVDYGDWDVRTAAMIEGKYFMSGAIGEPDLESLFSEVTEHLRMHPTGNGESSSSEIDSSQVSETTSPSTNKSEDK